MEHIDLATPDSIFPFLTSRQIMLLVGLIELGTVCILIFSMRDWLKASLLATLATGFFLYRLAHFYGHFDQPCDCFGHAWKWLSVARGDYERYSWRVFLVFIFLAGVYVALYLLSPNQKSTMIQQAEGEKAL